MILRSLAMALVSLPLLMACAHAQNQADATAKVVYELAPLPYAYDALEPAIDAKTMEIHYSKHHQAYFDNMLKALAGTEHDGKSLETLFASMSTLPVALRNNAGGHYNHSLFWTVLAPNAGGAPGGELGKAIDASFGSFDEFKKVFNQAATGRFGSGWAWLSVAADGSLVVSSTANQDNPLMDVAEQRGTPILGLDVWEHAYYLNYQNKRAAYVDAFWTLVNWPEVERRYAAAKGAVK